MLPHEFPDEGDLRHSNALNVSFYSDSDLKFRKRARKLAEKTSNLSKPPSERSS